MKFIVVLLVAICSLQGSAQLLVRTVSQGETSILSMGLDQQDLNTFQNNKLKGEIYYRTRYDSDGIEKSRYSIFSIYQRDSILEFCPYGLDIDVLHEKFGNGKGNTFRYWNKIRMGFKILIEESIYERATEDFWYYLNGEVYVSYLHLPQSARGDHQNKSRKGSVMMFARATASKRYLCYIKYSFGSTWIKGYYKKEQYTNYVGTFIEIQLNKKGYTRSFVGSSKDIYHGITVFGGPEYDLTHSQITLNLGFKITTENH